MCKAHLEDILQSELHDSRIPRREHLTESVAVEIRGRVVHVEAVCNVERLGSKFQLLRFTELERSGEGHIELPSAGTGNAAEAGISERAKRGYLECRGIEKLADGSVPVGVRSQLIDALVGSAVQHPILIGGHGHITARKDFEDR